LTPGTSIWFDWILVEVPTYTISDWQIADWSDRQYGAARRISKRGRTIDSQVKTAPT